MLGELVENLKKLHDMGYVHGDVRLLNTIPHEGRLVDFDFTKKADGLYPFNLQALPWDGKRAKFVDEAILDGDIGKLAMKKEHDLEAMLNVIRLFEARGSWSALIGGKTKCWPRTARTTSVTSLLL